MYSFHKAKPSRTSSVHLTEISKELPCRTLKMHILEDHMLEWLSMHQEDCGLMGEQGAESIHAKFNSSLRTNSLTCTTVILLF